MNNSTLGTDDNLDGNFSLPFLNATFNATALLNKTNNLNQTHTSLESLLSSLKFNALLALLFYIAFAFLLPRLPEVYAPKSIFAPPALRYIKPRSNIFVLLWRLWTIPTEQYIQHAGLDAFAFDQYLVIGAAVFTIFSLVGLPILLPLNILNQEKQKGIDVTSIGNVTETERLWGHAILTCLFVFTTVAAMHIGLMRVLKRRYICVTSQDYSSLVSARTVLVCGVPLSCLKGSTEEAEQRLRGIFEYFGPIEKITLNFDHLGDLEYLVWQRDKLAYSLEANLCKYVSSGGKESILEKLNVLHGSLDSQMKDLADLNEKVEKARKKKQQQSEDKKAKFIFVTFENQRSAQTLAQAVIGKGPWRFNECRSDVALHGDIIWENLKIDGRVKWIRLLISWSMCAALALLWVTITSFVVALANLNTLKAMFSFMKVLDKLPPSVFDYIQGVVAPLVVATLMAILPMFLQAITRFEGHVLNTEIQIGLMHKYYFFLVVNVLIVASFANALLSSIGKLIDNPAKAMKVLAKFMPKASTFFINYMVLQAFSGTGKLVLGLTRLALQMIYLRLSSTPRAVWSVYLSLEPTRWGVLFPTNVIIFAIGITYSTISPLILPFTALYFILVVPIYRYMFLYVYETPEHINLQGRAFANAIYYTFVALYLYELTMMGILTLNKAAGQTMLMFCCFGLTAASNHYFVRRFSGMLRWIPAEIYVRELIVEEEVDDLSTVMESEMQRNVAADGSFYSHPAMRTPCPTLWIPQDSTGVAQDQLAKLQSHNIRAVMDGATISEKGKLHIDPDRVNPVFYFK